MPLRPGPSPLSLLAAICSFPSTLLLVVLISLHALAGSALARDCLSDADSPEAALARNAGTKVWNDAGGSNALVLVRVTKDGVAKTKWIPLPESGSRIELSGALLEEAKAGGKTYLIHPSQQGVSYILPYSENELSEGFHPSKDCPRALREDRAIRGECSVVDFSKLEKATLVYGVAGEKCDALARIRIEDFEDESYRKSLTEARDILRELFELKSLGENRAPPIDRQATQILPEAKTRALGSQETKPADSSGPIRKNAPKPRGMDASGGN